MLIYKFNNDQTNVYIQIKLLNNSFVSNWKDYVTRTSKRLPNLSWSFSPHCVTQQLVTNLNYRFIIFNILKSFILLGKHYRIDYNAEIVELKSLLIDYSNLTQHHLNKWHRHFTSLGKNLDPFVSSTTFTDTSIDKIHHAIHELNNNSHLLEILTYSKLSRINKLVPYQMHYGLHATSASNLEPSKAIWGTETIEYITEEFNFSAQSYNHNVWINDDILGKDHFKCWFEEDDPNNNDIGGNNFMTPNIIFDPNKIFTKTIEDPEFQQFVINSNKKLNRYPIGDIENIDEIDWNNIINLKLKSIELDGSILWKYE